MAILSSSSEIQLRHQPFRGVFPDYHKNLRLCPMCESEKCYFLILFIYTVFFFNSEREKKKKIKAISTDGERIPSESFSYLIFPVTPKSI